MSKIKSVLTPEITKIILDSYAVVKKRTALWFFKNELTQDFKELSNATISTNNHQHNRKQLKPKQILQLWHEMEPESKRKYFNMAEVDDIRFKEQKSLWIAQIGSILAKDGNRPEKLVEAVRKFQEKQKEILVSLDKYEKNFDHMIQAQTTRSLYKNVIDKTDRMNPTVNSEDLMSSVPEYYRSILERPRRPPPPFILYASMNRDELMKLAKTEYEGASYLKVGAILWSEMDDKTRKEYEERYSKLMKEYASAMEQFKQTNCDNEDSYLEQASKEKKAFTHSLRMKLREFAVVPVNIRNAFNFFLMDNKNVPLTELTEIWRNLPESKKEKYRKMNEEDAARYYEEKKACDELRDDILKLIKQSKNSS